MYRKKLNRLREFYICVGCVYSIIALCYKPDFSDLDYKITNLKVHMYVCIQMDTAENPLIVYILISLLHSPCSKL